LNGNGEIKPCRLYVLVNKLIKTASYQNLLFKFYGQTIVYILQNGEIFEIKFMLRVIYLPYF